MRLSRFASLVRVAIILFGNLATDVLAREVLQPPIEKNTSIIQSYGLSANGVEIVAYSTPSTLPGANPPLLGLAARIGKEISPLKGLPQSPFRREYNGSSWFDASPRWIGDGSFLVFESDDVLCIADAVSRTVLLNQALTGFTKAPNADQWAAIRFRPIARNQEHLTGSERDTLWFIDPESLASRSDLATEDAPFSHIPSAQLDGIAVARPIWTEDGSGVVSAIYKDGHVDAVLFDAASQQQTKRLRLPGVSLTSDQALSPWFLKEVEASIGTAVRALNLLSSSSPKSSPRPSDGNLPPVSVRSNGALTPKPTQPSSTADAKVETSPLLASPGAEPSLVPAESRTPVWPWVVGILALVAIIAVALKRRA